MPPAKSLPDRLRRTQLFVEASEAELEAIANIGQRLKVERGRVIVRLGEFDEGNVYCVLSGHLKVTVHDPGGGEL